MIDFHQTNAHQGRKILPPINLHDRYEISKWMTVTLNHLSYINKILIYS